jgi:queuine tRNA-ribosyltransferase
MLDRESGETMHPGVGAEIEARCLYADASRLRERLEEPISEPLLLLDVGLGAGSNAALALQAAHAGAAPHRMLHVISFDLGLGAFELALASEPAAFGFVGPTLQAAQALCSEGVASSPRVHWTLRLGDLRQTLQALPAACADVVFWDPFSPRINAELWSTAIFTTLHGLCRERASVHTYSAATATRSALALAGFAVGMGPRVNEKQRHSTMAAVSPCDLAQPLDASWLRSLGQSSRAFPYDAPPDALARLSAVEQFTRDGVDRDRRAVE